MIDDWQDEWDLKRRGSDRNVNRRNTCRGAAYLNNRMEPSRQPSRAVMSPRRAAHLAH